MEKRSCKNCRCLELDKKEVRDSRLLGRYRYGCSKQKGGYICGFLTDDDKLEVLVCNLWRGNAKQPESESPSMDVLGEHLQKLFDRWNEWHHHGSPSVSETDGTCLNRLRLAIVNQMTQMESVVGDGYYPDCYYSPIPPVLSEGYMADREGIEASAAMALSRYRDNLDYAWMKGCSSDESTEERIKQFSNHEVQLERAIVERDFLSMKRLGRQDLILSELAAYRKKVFQKKEKSKGRKKRSVKGQLDLFEERVS